MTLTAIHNDTEAIEQLAVLRELLSGGEMLPTQLASASHWSPGLRLAAAVLAQAMDDIRSRRPDGRPHVQVSSALRWIYSDDTTWPLSFVRVCELLQLDVGWVRQMVRRWQRRGVVRGRNAAYRNAA